MRRRIFEAVLHHPCAASLIVRSKTTSARYVSWRDRDSTFEKLMKRYRNLNKVIAIQDLILANPTNNPPSVSIDFLDRLTQKHHHNRGVAKFLRKCPHIFHIFYNEEKSQPFCKLTENAFHISRLEAEAIKATLPTVVDRLVRLLAMSASKSLPLRAIFKVSRELGLPDDFEDSVIAQNPDLFKLSEAHELNTHILHLVKEFPSGHFTSAVENWRVVECCKEDCDIDQTSIQFSFKQKYPPYMRLRKKFEAKVKEWQKLPYIGPYDEVGEKRSTMGLEKRAVAIVHEFLSLTVEKMVEVEKISHFRKSFGIDLDIRDLFLDHPGIFYLSTKGKTHTVFLRDAYERDRLIDPNPVYEVRRKLLDLVILDCDDSVPSKLKRPEIEKCEESVVKNEHND